MENNKQSRMRVIEKDEIMKNKEYFAEKFSEGDENLKNLLMFCFDNEIETVACCAGHAKSDGMVELNPHFVLRACPENAAYIANLIGMLSSEDEIDLSLYRSSIKSTFRIGFSMQDSERLFRKILDVMETTKKESVTEYESKIPKPFSELGQLIRENKEIGFGYLTKNGLSIYSISILYDWQRRILENTGVNEVENKYRYVIKNGEEEQILDKIQKLRSGFEKYNKKGETAEGIEQ